LIKIEDGKVEFWYKDYKKKKVICEKMRLDAQEFIRRFIWHVLPHRFHKIRHFGFLANGRCKAAVTHIRQLLENLAEEVERSEDSMIGKSCPVCRRGILVPLFIKDGFGRIVAMYLNIFKEKYLFNTS
ncbi:MAG: transposase, partial [Deltaproteobacteria bacterium]|nr:transposase [Deltaproteobacteria bacterium]